MKQRVTVGRHRLCIDTQRVNYHCALRQVLHTFNDVIWHVSWSITGDILAVSGGDNKVCL